MRLGVERLRHELDLFVESRKSDSFRAQAFLTGVHPGKCRRVSRAQPLASRGVA